MNRLNVDMLIIQDGVHITPSEIASSIDLLSAVLARKGINRLAVMSSRVDLVVTAMGACQRESCQLLLLRQEVSPESSLWEHWEVDGLLRLDGSIDTNVGHGKPVSCSGFSILMSTSGTTGTPKIALHSLDRLLGRIKLLKAGAEPSTWLLTYHPASFAGMQVILSCLIGAGTIVAFDKWSVPQMCEASRKYGVSHISATPTFWRAFVLALGSDSGNLQLKQITLGGEVADQAILTRLRRLFPQAGITHIFAPTEAGALFAVRDGKSGFPAEWLESDISGVDLRLREGILEVKSQREMRGYVQAEDRTPFTEDGWLITNDLVEVHGDRALFKGRADSVINVGGAKVSPEEVESVLLEFPDVVEAVVYGIPNSITGSTVAADIRPVPQANEEELRPALLQFAKTRLEPFKVPRVLRFEQEITISDAGKKSRHND
jgi:acyl-coenzyme A synthetase/AMP-(fatty) acid ligase